MVHDLLLSALCEFMSFFSADCAFGHIRGLLRRNRGSVPSPMPVTVHSVFPMNVRLLLIASVSSAVLLSDRICSCAA